MSDVGQFFLGVGATAAGVALMALPVPGGRFLGTALISFGVGQIASGIAGRPSNEDMQSNVGSPEATLPVVYGTAKIGLKLNETWVNPNSSDREELIRGGIACVGSEDGSGIDSFERIWIDEVLAVNPVTEGDNASMRTGGVTSFFSDVVSYIAFRGTDTQPVPTPLNNRDSSRYPNDWRSRGLAHIQFALDKDKEVLPRPPNVTVEVRGNHVYDPRDSTWKFSNNPALVLLDYLTSSRYGADLFYPERDGGDTDLSEIDEQSFIDAANFCDEQVQDGSGGTQKRFTFDGWLDTGNRLNDNVNGILATMRGTLIHQTGKFRLVIRKAKSSSRTLDESDLVGNWRIRRGGSGKIPNRVVVKYGGGTRGDVTGDVQWPEVGDTTFLDQDAGHEKTMSVKLVGVQDEVRAQQIGMVLLKEAREDAALSVEAHASAMDLQVGEVVTIDHATPGWEGGSAKDFWIVGMELLPQERVRLTLKEYAASAYSLDAQTAPTPPPGSNLPDPTSTGAPTNLGLTSDSTTQQQTPAGDKIPRILATWDLPLDKGIDRIVVLEREDGAANWNVAGVVDPTDDQRLLFEPEGGEEADTWQVGVYVVQGQRQLKSSITTGTVGLDTDFVASDLLGSVVDVDLQESDFDGDGVVEGRLLVDVIDSGSYDLQFLTRQGRGTSWTNGANPTGVKQGDPTESDDVELVEAQNSFIALDVFEAGTSTRVGRRLIFTFDPDDVAHVTGIGVAIEDDGTPVVDAGGDSDTVKIYVTVTTDGSEPADPTSSNADATINARQGSVTLSALSVPKGGKARAKARGENAATELAPASTVKSDQDGRPGAQTNLEAAPTPTFELIASTLADDTLQYRIDGDAAPDTVGPIEVAWDVVTDITSPSFGSFQSAPQDVQVDRPELTEGGANVRFIVFKVRDAGTTGSPESEQQIIPIAPVHRRGMDGRGRVDEEEHTTGGDFPAGGTPTGAERELRDRQGAGGSLPTDYLSAERRTPDGVTSVLAEDGTIKAGLIRAADSAQIQNVLQRLQSGGNLDQDIKHGSGFRVSRHHEEARQQDGVTNVSFQNTYDAVPHTVVTPADGARVYSQANSGSDQRHRLKTSGLDKAGFDELIGEILIATTTTHIADGFGEDPGTQAGAPGATLTSDGDVTYANLEDADLGAPATFEVAFDWDATDLEIEDSATLHIEVNDGANSSNWTEVANYSLPPGNSGADQIVSFNKDLGANYDIRARLTVSASPQDQQDLSDAVTVTMHQEADTPAGVEWDRDDGSNTEPMSTNSQEKVLWQAEDTE